MLRFVVTGLHHWTAPLEVRERLAIGRGDLPRALQAMGERMGQGVILSTCNRSEFYSVCRDHVGPARLRDFIYEHFRTGPQELSPHLYTLEHDAAVQHLFRVASGLDSLILGEGQILGQVRSAFAAASRAGTVGGALSRLFHQAIRVGKRARTETAIGRHSLSVSRAAVELARSVLGDLSVARVLVIGVGETGKLAARALVQAGARQVAVTNRTLYRAEDLARELGGVAVPFDDLVDTLAWADVAISATGAPGYLLTRPLVHQALCQRPERPLFLMDIAVPRDVDPAVREVPGAYLYDVDDLRSFSQVSRQDREEEARRAEEMVAQEVERFMEWWRSLDAVSVIAALRERVEDIRKRELERTLRHFPGLSPEGRARLDTMTRALVNKILHPPIARLKEGQDPAHLRAARELFRLDRERPGNP